MRGGRSLTARSACCRGGWRWAGPRCSSGCGRGRPRSPAWRRRPPPPRPRERPPRDGAARRESVTELRARRSRLARAAAHLGKAGEHAQVLDAGEHAHGCLLRAQTGRSSQSCASGFVSGWLRRSARTERAPAPPCHCRGPCCRVRAPAQSAAVCGEHAGRRNTARPRVATASVALRARLLAHADRRAARRDRPARERGGEGQQRSDGCEHL